MNMKLTGKEIEEIAKIYNLGKVKNIKAIVGGMINYNFIFKTDKGDFIVRRLGYKLDNYWGRQKELEFAVIEYLRKKKFPYEIPNFIKNQEGKYISKIGKDLFEVYSRIKGKNIRKVNKSQSKEIGKALALYHKYVAGFLEKYPVEDLNSYDWVFDKYKKMRKSKPKDDIDCVMLKELDFFDNLLRGLKEEFVCTDVLVIHADFSRDNLLFSGNKLLGILDFENLKFDPKIYDIAFVTAIEDIDREVFLRAYRKHNSFNSRDENKLVVYRLLQKCLVFWWIYLDLKKRKDLRRKWFGWIMKGVRKDYKLWSKK